MTVTHEASTKGLERMMRRRAVDAEGASLLVSLGWNQAGVLDGLMWCPVCAQPTVWKDGAGVPTHIWCSESNSGVTQ